jgi:hypothetical protein
MCYVEGVAIHTLLANVLVHMKTFTLFLLSVIYVIYYGLKTKEFFFFRACLNIALSVVYFLYYSYVIGLMGILIYFLCMFLCIVYVLLIIPVHFFLTNAVLLELNLSGLQGIPLFKLFMLVLLGCLPAVFEQCSLLSTAGLNKETKVEKL